MTRPIPPYPPRRTLWLGLDLEDLLVPLVFLALVARHEMPVILNAISDSCIARAAVEDSTSALACLSRHTRGHFVRAARHISRPTRCILNSDVI